MHWTALNSGDIRNMLRYAIVYVSYIGICAIKCNPYIWHREHISMSSRYASSKPPQMYKCRYAYLRYYLSHIVATCEISESAVAYLCRKLYIGSRKKQVDLSVYCSARDMWACDHVPCDIYVQLILWQYDAGFSYMVWYAHKMGDIQEIRRAWIYRQYGRQYVKYAPICAICAICALAARCAI